LSTDRLGRACHYGSFGPKGSSLPTALKPFFLSRNVELNGLLFVAPAYIFYWGNFLLFAVQFWETLHSVTQYIIQQFGKNYRDADLSEVSLN
jgi:hypothetical protein